MIARPLRLRHSFEFARIRKHGRSSSTGVVVVATLPNDLGHNRYGFVVGRRIGKSVVRNRVRRWLRETIRLLEPELRQGYDVVLIARGLIGGPEVTYHRVFEAVRAASKRVGLLLDASSSKGEAVHISQDNRS